MRQENRHLRRQIELIAERTRGIWDRLVRAFVKPEPRPRKFTSKTKEQKMAYGDSANWDGAVPTASDTTFKIEWKTKFQGPKPALDCEFFVNSGDDSEAVSIAMAQAWNSQNSHARRAIRVVGIPNQACRVQFDGVVNKMEVRAYDFINPPNPLPNFHELEYGVRKELLTNNTTGVKLFVFKA